MGSFLDDDEVTRTVSDAPPTHYTVKVQSFSLLLKNSIDKYESGEFEAGGYKWKLMLYPSGNTKKNVTDHISVYIAMSDTSSLQLGWEVYAVFRLFMLDQNRDKYFILEDGTGKEKRFHALKLEWGFDRFISLKVFNDASNGYLLEDTCAFGAEVFVRKERRKGKGECLSMIKDAPTTKYLWRIENFSNLDKECYDSSVFIAGDQKWKIQLYPKGRQRGSGSHISLYLALADPTTTPPGSKIHADLTMRILDQIQARHYSGKADYWFSETNKERGWARYISFSYLNLSGSGRIVKDVCLVEAEVTVHGISSPMQCNQVYIIFINLFVLTRKPVSNPFN
ncbi:Ubiquitin carboxyl-terminal hydrolase 12 [Melia azedarach]|uniref:Ubiquitin carboxyl-terminal hydrolase 12 n=1 Tax=Melia azedarach TaxID=155640 RepID=A0ACC1WQ46_MELAZ|nr:Ubiquitin carboxyl-terminal hydrolase 12 [Melia azedarach]